MLKKYTILVVDDSKIQRKSTEKILEKNGYYVLSVGGGKRAVKLAMKKKIDLILMDLMMPGISGFEAIELLKKNEETINIPIIALSSISQPEDVSKAIVLGAEDFIEKPFSIKNLDLINEVLNNK